MGTAAVEQDAASVGGCVGMNLGVGKRHPGGGIGDIDPPSATDVIAVVTDYAVIDRGSGAVDKHPGIGSAGDREAVEQR